MRTPPRSPSPPQDHGLRKGLDGAVFRMLRGARWLALLCLVIAALAGRTFPTGDDPTALPGPLGWARLIIGQAAWCTLTAVVIVTVSWSERIVPQVLFRVALVPTLLTVWFERAAIRT
ncbi:hypothetical protein ACFY0G_28275 [Streptomyces sp. NPDC001552]|uniref:hypothetical protein n=1 Tax=Streptomyces sp. NPDC001552 TaxID=3364587 RepID=UPI0036B34252